MQEKRIYVNIFIYFNMYLFYMKKLLIILSILFIFIEKSFASVWSSEIDKTKQHISFVSSFLSTELLLNIIFATIVLLVTFALTKLVSRKIVWYVEKNWEWREELVWVLTRVSNISILTLWWAISLWILWIDMWIFMWGLWFWLGFTLKIFLSNFIAWVIMVTQWTYHNWDIIKIWDKIWKIRKINSLFTELEQFDWVIFYTPNVKFLEDEVLNYNTNDKRRVEVNVGVDYDTDLLKAKKIMLQVLRQFPNILQAPESNIFIDKFDDSSINLSLRFWINSSDQYFLIKSNVTETINLAFKQAGITIPFPQITLSNRSDFNIKMSK